MSCQIEIKKLVQYYGMKQVLESLISAIGTPNGDGYIDQLINDLSSTLAKYQARYK